MQSNYAFKPTAEHGFPLSCCAWRGGGLTRRWMAMPPLSQVQIERLKMFTNDCERISDDKHFLALLNSVSSPLEMYYIPWLLNWDDSRTEKAIEWILQSPHCDAGTALAIYWLACPTDWKERTVDPEGDEWENERIAFFRGLEERMKALEFPSKTIAYDPRLDWRHWERSGEEKSILVGIPAHMKVPTPGEPVPAFQTVGV